MRMNMCVYMWTSDKFNVIITSNAAQELESGEDVRGRANAVTVRKLSKEAQL